MKELCADDIVDYLEYFNDYSRESRGPKGNIDEDRKITVYCQSMKEEGFIIDSYRREVGFDLLIAKKWIYHSDLVELINKKEYLSGTN